MNRTVFDDWAEVMAKGDWMMVGLMTIAALLWFSLGFRALLLIRGSRAPLSQLLRHPPSFVPHPHRFRGFVVEAVALAHEVRRRGSRPLATAMDAVLHPLSERMRSMRSLVMALVGLAPMAGLLGTVSGMMVMFDSIGQSNFSSQTGGITNGIAQALFTTETALVIAVPCLVLGHLLNRKEDGMRVELEQIVRTLSSEHPEV